MSKAAEQIRVHELEIQRLQVRILELRVNEPIAEFGRWIPVEERLPPLDAQTDKPVEAQTSALVLASIRGVGAYVWPARYWGSGSWGSEDNWELHEVTHWMPFPPAAITAPSGPST